MSPRVAGAGDHKGPFARDRFQPIVRSLGHQVPINIVHLRMHRRITVIGKDNIIGDRTVEAGWFIHIIPDSRHPLFGESPVLLPPPPTRFAVGEIRVDHISRPHPVYIGNAIFIKQIKALL